MKLPCSSLRTKIPISGTWHGHVLLWERIQCLICWTLWEVSLSRCETSSPSYMLLDAKVPRPWSFFKKWNKAKVLEKHHWTSQEIQQNPQKYKKICSFHCLLGGTLSKVLPSGPLLWLPGLEPQISAAQVLWARSLQCGRFMCWALLWWNRKQATS